MNSPVGNLSDPIEETGSFDRDFIMLAAFFEDTVVLQSCCFLSLSFLRRAELYADWACLRLTMSAGLPDLALLKHFRRIFRSFLRFESKKVADLPSLNLFAGQAF